MKVVQPSRYAVGDIIYPDGFRAGPSPHCTPEEMDENLHRYKRLTGSLPAVAITAAFQFDDPPFRFPFELMEVMDQRGVVPDVILWLYGDGPLGGGCLDQINSGSLDNVFRARAAELYDWSYGGRRPVMMQFGTEVTLGSYPWSAANNGGWEMTGNVSSQPWPLAPAKYIDANRRAHSIFREAGCEVTWLWHTLANFTDQYNDPIYYYPGNAFVDWVGFGLYRDLEGGLWSTFESGFTESMRQMAFIWGRKPGYVELMCQEKDGDPSFKADFLRDAFSGLAGYVNAIGYWDAYTAMVPAARHIGPAPKGPLPLTREVLVPALMGIDSRPESLAAYRAGVSGEWYSNRVRLA